MAVKVGSDPQFCKLTMLADSTNGGVDKYVAEHSLVYRPAPTILCEQMGMAVGLAMRVVPTASRAQSRQMAASTKKGHMSGQAKGHGVGEDAMGSDEMSHVTNEDGEEEDDDDGGDDDYLDEEDLLHSLEQRLEALTAEKDQLASANEDLQKKCCTLIAKEKSLQSSQNSAIKSSAIDSLHLDADQLQEKERHFRDTLELIVEGDV